MKGIYLTFDAKKHKDTINKIDKFKRRFETVSTLMKAISILMYQNVMRNFQREGTEKEKWKPLSKFTLFVKKYRAEKPTMKTKILHDTGMLRNSIYPYSDEKTASVGTNLPYARLHQFGGMSTPSEVVIKSHTRKRKGKEYKVKSYTMRIGSHPIPARPFLVLDRKTVDKIYSITRQHFYGYG